MEFGKFKIIRQCGEFGKITIQCSLYAWEEYIIH